MEYIYPLLVVALGFGVLGITGFGSALISVPLLAWIWPLHQVVALVLSIDFIACLLLGGLQWRLIQWRAIGPFCFWLLLGVALGAGLSQLPGVTNSTALLVALGLYVAGSGWRGLRSAAARHKSVLRHASVSGLLGGVIEFIWGISGSVVVGHLVTRFEDPRIMRAHITLCLMLASGLACLTLAASGRLDSAELRHWWPPLMVVALASMLLGHRWSQRVLAQQLRRYIMGLLVFSGLALAAHGLRGMA
jgi:uncharacterized membrane protein YfcA